MQEDEAVTVGSRHKTKSIARMRQSHLAYSWWNEWRVYILVRLRKLGHSFSECAYVLGCTKNQAVGKWHRMRAT